MKKFLVLCCTCFALGAHAVLTVTTGMFPEVCGYGNGVAFASAYGGVTPYTYSWDNGGTGSQITGLLPGTYTVTVTDNVGAQATSSITVTASNQLRDAAQTMSPTCPGQCTGEVWIWKDQLAGVAPYTFDPPGGETADHVEYFDACAFAQSIVLVTDQNGCTSNQVLWAWNAYSAQVAFIQVMPSCQGSDGHVIFSLDYVDFTTLRVFDSQLNEVYSDPDPPSGMPIDSVIPIMVDGLAPGDYFIRCITEELPGEWCYNEYPFTIPDLGTDCGRIMGDLYVDADDDCVFTVGGETSMPYRIMTVEPGPNYGITDANGHYTVNLDVGSYTIANNDADLFPICPATEPVAFDITLLDPVVIQDLADSSNQLWDLEMSCAHGDARPGFIHQAWLTVKNLSPYWSYGNVLTYTFDPILTFVSSSPYNPASSSAGQLTWNLGTIQGFGTRTILVQLQVPPDVGLLGTALLSDASVQQQAVEQDLNNNTCNESVIVTGSYDPNDKTAFTSTRSSEELYFIDQDEWIDYVIRFQNTGTASAVNIEVSDTLEAELDPGTMQLLGWSHQLDRVAITPGPVMHWYFDNIWLPDSGASEAASHGFVSFRIKPHLPILPGTIIENTANIFFDFNPPVITEPSVLVAEFSTSEVEERSAGISVYPNPTTNGIDVLSDGTPIHRVSITALDGRIILDRTVNGTRARIDLADVASGTYVLLVHGSDGATHRTSLIKQNP